MFFAELLTAEHGLWVDPNGSIHVLEGCSAVARETARGLRDAADEADRLASGVTARSQFRQRNALLAIARKHRRSAETIETQCDKMEGV